MKTQRSSLAVRSGENVLFRGQKGITCIELTLEPMSMNEFSKRIKRDRERVQRQDQRWPWGNSLEGGRPAIERREHRSGGRVKVEQCLGGSQDLQES